MAARGWSGGTHEGFDGGGLVWETLDEVDEMAVAADVEDVLDADADVFLGDVDAGFDGEDHAAVEFRGAVVHGVVDVDADGVAEAVDEVLAERLAVEVFAVGVDVVEGDFVERIGDVGGAFVDVAEAVFAGDEGGGGGLLGAEDDVVDLALTGREVAVDGHGSGDVGGVHAVFAGFIDDDDVAGLHDAIVRGVVEGGGVWAGTDDGGVAGTLAAFSHHFFDLDAGDGSLADAGVDGAHACFLREDGGVAGFAERSISAGDFTSRSGVVSARTSLSGGGSAMPKDAARKARVAVAAGMSS